MLVSDESIGSQAVYCDSLEPLLFVVERSGEILNINPAVLRLSGVSDDQILGQSLRSFLLKLSEEWSDLLPHSVHSFVAQSVFLPWAHGKPEGLGWHVHAILIGPDPSTNYILSDSGWHVHALRPGPSPQEKIALSFVPGLAPEISSRVPQEDLSQDISRTLHDLYLRAQQSEVRFRRLLKLLPGISLIQKNDLDFVQHGPELRMLLGEKPFELLDSVSWTDWIHPDDRNDFFNSVTRCEKGHHPVSVKLRLVLPNQKMLDLLDIRFPVIGLNGQTRSFEVHWIDLSRQRTAERRLHEFAWKESLSEISGSLTHDFNNLMTGIVNLSGLLLGDNDEELIQVERSNLDLIYTSAQQAQNLLQQVVSLNKTKPGTVELFELNQFVREQYDLIRIVLPQRIRFKMDLLEEELPVRMDKVALSRTLLNFATNARDAIKGKGEALLSLSLVKLAEYPREHIFSAICPKRGRAVELRFSDDGCGIPANIINQIFSPYFSTKSEKSGSGLGLSSLYRYAEENGFDFGVCSKEGAGSEMFLLLPLDELEQATETADPEMLRPFFPAYNENLLVSIYSNDLKYASFMESNFAQDYGTHVRVLASLAEAVFWLESENSEGTVFVGHFDFFEEIPAILLERLEEAFGKTNRILLLAKEDVAIYLDSVKKGKYFDGIFQSAHQPGADCQRILRSLGHHSLFAAQDFS